MQITCRECGKETKVWFDSEEFDAWGPDGKSRTYNRGVGTWRTKCCDAEVDRDDVQEIETYYDEMKWDR